jgi:hypothetical protein
MSNETQTVHSERQFKYYWSVGPIRSSHFILVSPMERGVPVIFFLVKNRLKVTLKEKGEHSVSSSSYLKNPPADLEAKLDFPMGCCDIYGYYRPILKCSP